ncbi:MAG: hypothetical protein ACLT8L_00575 [Streptococcus salivarius]
MIAGIVVAVLALTGYSFGSYYYSRGQVAERYETAAKKSFKDSLEYQVWSDTKKEIKTSEVKYTDTKTQQPIARANSCLVNVCKRLDASSLSFQSGESWLILEQLI